MSHPLISKAILWFFNELNYRNIVYAVLRKVELIPDTIGNDIDVLIGGGEGSAVLKVINDCAKEFGFKVYERRNVGGLYCILYAFASLSTFSNQQSIVYFRLDFTNPVANPDKLLFKRIQNEKGIYYLPDGFYKKKKKSRIKNLMTYPLRFFFSPGKFVVIVGPDGVGKTTTAELVTQILRAFHIPVKHMHLGFRPSVLPTRKSVMSLGKENLSAPGEKSKVPGIVRFFYHALDYILGYFLKVRPFLVNGRIVFVERYYYNYLVDPRKQHELKFPSWLSWIVYKFFIPKPDIVILFSNDPEEIFKRRQEHSVQEIERQIKVYRDIGKKAKHFFETKTDKPIDKVAMEIVSKLISESLYLTKEDDK